jgi:maleate isomerase
VKAAIQGPPQPPQAPSVQGRIGLLVPSSNTTVEPEFYRALPPGITLHCARLYLTRIDPESIHRTQDELERESRSLASADVDVIVLGATAPSFLHGVGYDRELIARIESATGKRATTTSTAMLAALRALGARRIGLGSAYDATVNGIAAAFLEANGLQVLRREGLGYVDNLEVGRLAPETALEVARRVDDPQADAVLLACTNWRSLHAVEPLEAELGKPVVTTTQASLWQALRMVGHTGGLPGYGCLFDRPA